MCRLVSAAAGRGGTFFLLNINMDLIISLLEMQVIIDARRIAGETEDSDYLPLDPKEFASRIFHTCYMGTENSSAETRRRAKQLSGAIGRYDQ